MRITITMLIGMSITILGCRSDKSLETQEDSAEWWETEEEQSGDIESTA